MSSLFQSFQQQKGLPLSHRPSNSNGSNFTKADHDEQSGQLGGIRRRLSSLSLNMMQQQQQQLQPLSTISSWGAALRRSKSHVSDYAEPGIHSIRKWWDWGWAWILSRKPSFAKDLEMNEAETAALGCHNQGSWRHVFYKLKSLVASAASGGFGSSHDVNMGLPLTFRAKNFDHGKPTPSTTTY